MSQRQGTVGRTPPDHLRSHPSLGKKVVPETLANKTGFTYLSRRHKVAVGAQGERFKVLRVWAVGRDMNAPASVPETIGIGDASRFGQVYASLLMSTDTGTEAHSIVDNMPGDIGLEAWRRLAHRFDPASTQTNMNLILKPTKGRIDNISRCFAGRTSAPAGKFRFTKRSGQSCWTSPRPNWRNTACSI